MKKAFTIVELLVAMALLAILIAISGMVFSTAVKAYRTATAASEIAAKLSSVTERLDRDFQSIPAGTPIAIWLEYNSTTGNRYDQIQFFSAGDNFQSSKQWPHRNATNTATTDETLSGNTARIYYGHANQVRISGFTRTPYRSYNYSSYINPAEQATGTILSRRVHILEVVNSALLPFPANITYSATTPVTVDYTSAIFLPRFIPWYTTSLYGNDVFEYDDVSFSEWMNILSVSANMDRYLTTCLDNTVGRPGVDLTATDAQSLHMVLAQGIGSFSIQLAYTTEDMRLRSAPLDSDLNRPVFTEIRWWPSTDPDDDSTTSDSDFGSTGMNANLFGCYMQFPGTPTLSGWYTTSNCLSQTLWRFRSDYFPKAIKFTFTLYDSSGVFKDGKTFTHIVYLK